MTPIANLEQALRFLEPAFIVILLARIAAQKLLHVYKAFVLYLLIWLGQDIVPLALGYGLSGDLYAKFFFISEPLAWLFSALVLVELFGLTFRDFPKIKSAGRLLLGSAIVIAALFATLTAVPSLLHVEGRSWLLLLYTVIERSVMIVTLILVGTLQFLMIRYPLRLARNTLRYGAGYAVYFTARAFQSLLVSELNQQLSTAGNAAAMAIDICCLVYWTVTLSRAGVHAEAQPSPRFSEADTKQMAETLENVNDFLGRISKARRNKKLPPAA